MPLLVPNPGEVWMLQQITGFNNAYANTLYLKLYQNNLTPSETDSVGSYTEANFTGYNSIELKTTNWVCGTNSTGYSNATYGLSAQTFTSTAPQSTQQIYGYYITSNASGQLVWAERFSDGPYPITNNGDQIKITPYIELA